VEYIFQEFWFGDYKFVLVDFLHWWKYQHPARSNCLRAGSAAISWPFGTCWAYRPCCCVYKSKKLVFYVITTLPGPGVHMKEAILIKKIYYTK